MFSLYNYLSRTVRSNVRLLMIKNNITNNKMNSLVLFKGEHMYMYNMKETASNLSESKVIEKNMRFYRNLMKAL